MIVTSDVSGTLSLVAIVSLSSSTEFSVADSTTEVARDALKDIIIHLQQQVISNLKIHWQQDTFVDFTALQDVSDSSQDRCILVLMQLQQRLITSGPIENLTPAPLNIPSAYNQRALPEIPLVHTHNQTSRNPYASPPTDHVTSPVPTSPDQYERGFAFTAPPSRQNTGPLTPPHSPYSQKASSYTQSPMAAQPAPYSTSTSTPLTQSPTTQFAPFQTNNSQHPPPTAYASIPGNPYATSQAPASPTSVPQSNQMSAAQFTLPQQTQASVPQYSPTQLPHTQSSLAQSPVSQYPPALQPVNQSTLPPRFPQSIPFHHRDGSREIPDRRPTFDTRSNSSQSQYKPIGATTEKVGFFGIRKTKVERIPEPPENPLVDKYLAAALEEEYRTTSQAGSIKESRSTSPNSNREANPDHPNFNPWQQDNHGDDSITPATSAARTMTSPYPQPMERAKPSMDSLARPPTQQSNHSSHSNAQLEVLASNRPIHSINPKDLLPSELNKYAGFCKGAWRQQIGDRKKALEQRARPVGINNAARFLQCKTCRFEGRFVPTNQKQHGFDMRVFKLVEGIQFRWEFLFKSHVHTKDLMPDPTKGIFGCMFCCAEGRGTPTFHGVSIFMEHLIEHRSRLPTGEVLYRMNCLVGRQAGTNEDFDINIASREGAVF